MLLICCRPSTTSAADYTSLFLIYVWYKFLNFYDYDYVSQAYRIAFSWQVLAIVASWHSSYLVRWEGTSATLAILAS